ncbi:SBBP repeat-containing protein [Hymenobacter sp. GOD-10R]|uniref:SBBP repeat-containing protein n=1 Tax=Hymenobacter sp. GOD-10R TaxID=3093922 RepID=UPI002D766739|nr:SBBP repeat-containing protein [Hymenobacter sp. GOD-10R]WRQ27311.1 SBBP repeat-containing protein [Hymenobacter sp. GOD-10R]
MLFALALLSEVAGAQTFDQVTAIDAKLGNGISQGASIVADAAGNVFVAGTFQGAITFGATTLEHNSRGLTYEGSDAVFVAKLDAAGNWLWAVRGGDVGFIYPRKVSLTLNAANKLYLTANLAGSFTFGTTTLTGTNTGTDIMVAQLNGTDGAWQWATSATISNNISADVSPRSGIGIALDATGHAFVTGNFKGNATFNNAATAPLTLSSNGGAEDVFVARLDAGTGTWQWAVQGGGTGHDQARNIAADATGNIYVTGSFQGTAASPATFKAASGTLTLVSAENSPDIFVARLDGSNGAWQWIVRGGSTHEDSGASVASDGTGHVYVTGGFWGGGNKSSYPPIPIPAATFDSPSGASLSPAGSKGSDVFVARLDAATGDWQWVVRGGSGSNSFGGSIAVDAAGTPYVTGSTSGGADFTPTTSGSPIRLLSTSENGSYANTFVARLEPSTGKWQWAVGATSLLSWLGNRSHSIALGRDGHLYTTGFYNNNGTFGSSPATAVVGGDRQNAFVAQVEASSGNWQWVASPDAGGPKQTSSAATDAAGNIYVAGTFQGKLTLGTVTMTSLGTAQTGFIAKQDPAGNWLWAVRIASAYLGTTAIGITTDVLGHVYATGSFGGQKVSFYSATAGTPITLTGRTSALVAYVAQLDAATGAWKWAVRNDLTGLSGPAGICIGQRVTVDAAGNPYVLGLFAGTATFTGTSGTISLTTATGSGIEPDIFVARLAPADGSWQWAVRAGGSSNEFCDGIAADATGHLFVAGAYIGNATFSNPGGGQLTLPGYVNGVDAFVARLDAATGTWQWTASGGSYSPYVGADDYINAIALDNSGDAYVVGSFTGNATFGSLSLSTGAATERSSKMFVARLNGATGAWRWVVRAGNGEDRATAIRVDATGHVYMAGHLLGTATFDSPTLAPLLTATSQGGTDAFVARLDGTTGTWQNLATGGGSANEQSTDLLLAPQNRVYLVGNYQSIKPTFGSASVPNGGLQYSTGFVARLSSGWVLPVREKQLEGQKASFRVFPTVVGTGQSLRYTVEEQLGKEALIELYAVTGQRVAQWSVSAATGALPAPALRAGVYLVRLTSAETTQTTRIVVY